MAIKQRGPQRLKQLLKSCGARVDARVREQLAALPAGWSRPVSGMFARVERILTDEERQTFRWTEVRDRDGRLAASWSGARDSGVLIDQIVEEAVTDLSDTGPAGWKNSAAELATSIRGMAAKASSPAAAAKAAAAALPIMIAEAQAYFRNPDAEAGAITQQIREALQRLDHEARRSLRAKLIPDAS
ncbi:MAG: hypothetical protein ACRC67_24625 [Inquilinus sp.]|jgi:hypothetical protein|uniref:hypothetical protein n=1 Tax=Bacteria TaxID=2 RepID=UPI00110FF5DF|nr:hypothetical protein [Mycobacterium sp. KBS0706]TSD87353.1 hypothetical protein FFK22_017810 [Mycobacterium sp. KBS0706]